MASRGNLPWIVPLFKKTELGLQFLCSGSLITCQHVVTGIKYFLENLYECKFFYNHHLFTAAHCVKSTPTQVTDKKYFLAYVGRFNISNWTEEHTQPREIGEIFIHPDYNPETLYSDIAVLKLSTEVVISQYVNPVCISPGEDNLSNVVGVQGLVSFKTGKKNYFPRKL